MKRVPLKNFVTKKSIILLLTIFIIIDISIGTLLYLLYNNFIEYYTENATVTIKNLIKDKEIQEYSYEKNYETLLYKKLKKIPLDITNIEDLIFLLHTQTNNNTYSEFGIKGMDYYIIDPNGIIIQTSYVQDKDFDFSQVSDKKTWLTLKNLKSGEFISPPFSVEVHSDTLRKYGYMKLNNGYIAEIGLIINESILRTVYYNMNNAISNYKYLSGFGIYHSNIVHPDRFRPLFSVFPQLSYSEMDLITESYRKNKTMKNLIGDKVLIAVPWLRISSDKRLSETAMIKLYIDVSGIRFNMNITFFIINIIFISMFLFALTATRKLADIVIKPLNILITNMRNFANNKLYTIDERLEKNKITELDNLLSQYTYMADELMATLEEYNATNESLEASYYEIERAYDYFTRKLVDIVEGYDETTGNHVERVGILSEFIAIKMGETEHFASEIRKYSPLHDIGKIAIPQSILLKTEKLTSDEFEIMKKHTLYGAELLGDDPLFHMARNIAFYHHEKYNGKGYSCELSGDEIPIEAAIVSLVDVYDALRSKRPYKKSFTHDESYKIIVNGDSRTSPEDFHPRVLKVFIENHQEISELWKDSNR